MKEEEAKNILLRLKEEIKEGEVTLKCECSNLETVFISLDSRDQLWVTDNSLTFQYLSEHKGSTYVQVENIDMETAEKICQDLKISLIPPEEDGYHMIGCSVLPKEDVFAVVERVADGIDHIFKLALRPDLRS